MRKLSVILAFSIVLAFIFGNIGCDSDPVTLAPTSTSIFTPTSTPPPTTLAPTDTATQTPSPTATAKPTVSPMPTETVLFLEISQPTDEAQVSTSPILITGRTIPEAVVSLLINEEIEIADVDQNGNFSVSIYLEEGPNLVEVIASDQYGNENSVIIVVSYVP